MSERERALALMAAMVHSDYQSAGHMLPTTIAEGRAVSLDLSMIAAALLINWSKEVGIDPKDLLADIALGQALDATTR